MCGIAGELRFDGQQPDISAISRMIGAQAARGPDADGIWASGPVALGHRRLSIIDRQGRAEAHGASRHRRAPCRPRRGPRSRRLLPVEVVDRPKGYFPVPGLQRLEGSLLDLVQDVLGSTAAQDRGVLDPTYVRRLLAEPNGHHSASGANLLWQLAVVELWLDEHLADVAVAHRSAHSRRQHAA